MIREGDFTFCEKLNFFYLLFRPLLIGTRSLLAELAFNVSGWAHNKVRLETVQMDS